MKHGRKPTRKQKQLLKHHGKNPEMWLVVKNLPDKLHIAHRHTGTKDFIPKSL